MNVMSDKKLLTYDDLSSMYGVAPGTLSSEVQDWIQRVDFTYQPLSETDRDHTILSILKALEQNQFSLVGQQRQGIWEEVWAEHLQNFVAQEYAAEALVPRFIRPAPIVRLQGNYVHPLSPTFELDFFRIFRLWLFQTYLKEWTSVYEFGCGSGFNLLALAELYPDKQLWGMDWVESSVQLVTLTGESRQLSLKGRQFDFFAPDSTIELGRESAVITIAALEQVGTQFQPFLAFLLDKRPGLCIHIEPVLEFYDENSLVDFLAIQYHYRRGYLQGFYSALKALKNAGQIEILASRRLGFGSLYHEAYSLMVWRSIALSEYL
jgi:SAM-dependent methyltransferase